MNSKEAKEIFREELRKSKEKEDGRVARSADGDENVLSKEEHD